MREIDLNLARRPFVNTRPVVRLTVFLWLAGALLFAGNLWLFASYFQGSGAKAKRLSEIDATLGAERSQVSQAQAQLAGLDLGKQNATVAFLNRKIAERSFSWSRLLDHLATVLPTGVRLLSLAPERGGREREPRPDELPAAGGKARPVPLSILGEAKTDEAILAFVDALFADPAFRNPNPQRESRGDDGVVRFDLAVEYLPEPAASAPAGKSEEAAKPEEGAP